MLLYICPECGRWTDVSLINALGSMFESLARSINADQPSEKVDDPMAVQCKNGCGQMILVRPDDKLSIWESKVEIKRG